MTNTRQDSSSAEQPGKRILAIAGSLRHGSWNRRLLEAAAANAPVGMTISVYGDLASIPMFNEDLELETDGGPDAVRQLRRGVASADGLLIATPEYNQSIPGVLKNAIDWLSRAAPDEALAGKPVAIVGASGGAGAPAWPSTPCARRWWPRNRWSCPRRQFSSAMWMACSMMPAG